MERDIGVLIADDNIELGNLLNEYIGRESGMKVVGVATDGIQTIEMITALKPDVVILDAIMPYLDGLGVLERVSRMQLDLKPLFIMLTAVGKEAFIKRAMELGVYYYMVKPFDISELVARTKEVCRHMGSVSSNGGHMLTSEAGDTGSLYNALELTVTSMLHNMGVPTHMSGYQYMREAIIRAAKNPKPFGFITKVLYPAIAGKFDTTPSRVERAIRNAIESTWQSGNMDLINSVFGSTASSRSRPTNSEFISMLADKARVGMEKK